jgi:hypothetical protein
MGEEEEKKKKNACRLLVGKPEGKSPLSGPSRKLVNNMKKILER